MLTMTKTDLSPIFLNLKMLTISVRAITPEMVRITDYLNFMYMLHAHQWVCRAMQTGVRTWTAPNPSCVVHSHRVTGQETGRLSSHSRYCVCGCVYIERVQSKCSCELYEHLSTFMEYLMVVEDLREMLAST